MAELSGRIALVTGAGRGIGAAAARKLALRGARVLVSDIDADVAAATVAAITAGGGTAHAHCGDLRDAAFAGQLIDAALARFGGLDIVVNNAGYVWNGALHKHSDAQWDAMLDMHAGAPFRVLRAWAPWLREQVGRERQSDDGPRVRKVVNISSVSGLDGAATQVAYSAAKSAVVGLTRTLAKEWGPLAVTVNCVAFGHIETRLTQPYSAGAVPTIRVGDGDYRVGLSDAQIDASRRMTPLGRSGTPDDAAGAICLFCIPDSDFITGEVLVCSGGLRS